MPPVSDVLLKNANSSADSSQIRAVLLRSPRSMINPQSLPGEPPVVFLLRTINGSSTSKFAVSIVVVVPLTVRFPAMVTSDCVAVA